MTITKSTEPVFKPGASFKAISLQYGGDRWDLPCAVSWCIGHNVIECDEWSELTHEASVVELFGAHPDREGTVNAIREGDAGAPSVSVYIKVEEVVDLRGAQTIVDALRNAADEIERTARRHPDIIASGRIGGA